MKDRPRHDMTEYDDARHILSVLQKQLNDAIETVPHLRSKLQFKRVNKYEYLTLQTPPQIVKCTPEEIAYFGEVDSIKEQEDLEAAKCLVTWCECVNSLYEPDCYVFSIGSGSQDKQQMPEFVRKRKDGFTAILNIDPIEIESNETPHYIKSSLGTFLRPNTKLMEALIEQVGKLIELGKKVVILDFCAPTHVMAYKDLFEKHKLSVDKNLTFIQGYFTFYPLLQIHAGAITSEIDTNLENVIDRLRKADPHLKSKYPTLPLPQFTTCYPHVDNIIYEQLFMPEIVEVLASQKPSKTAETLFSSPAGYDKKILDNFFEKREVFNEAPDGKGSWEITNQELIDSVVAIIPEKYHVNIDLFTIERGELEKLIQVGDAEDLNTKVEKRL